VTSRLSFRRLILSFHLGDRVGKLVKVCPSSIEEAQDRVPTDTATPTLDLRDIGRMYAEPDRHLVLSQLRSVAQRLECSTEHELISGSVAHLSSFSQDGLSSGNPKIVPPRCCRSRGRGTEAKDFDALVTIAVSVIVAASPEHSAEVPPTKEEPRMTSTLTIPATGIRDAREALLCLLNEPVESLAHTLTLPEHELHPEWFEDGRRQFDQICRLLDVIGWDASAPPRKVEIAGEDAPTIRRAIDGYLPMVEEWLAEASQLRKRREHRDSVQAMWTLLAAFPHVGANEKAA
jgi:hypothetical protein